RSMRFPSGRYTSGGLAAIRNFGRTVCSGSKTIFSPDPKPNKPRTAPRRKPQQEKCMYTKDAIRYSLNMADQAVMRSLQTIEDAPLTFPTENGGCHPLWVVGHLAFVEGLTHEILGGGGNPVGEWAARFGQD